MGKKDNPVRDILDYAEDNFISSLPVFYILTVCGWDNSGRYGVKGIFAGDTKECFNKASAASFNENITILGNKIDKILSPRDRCWSILPEYWQQPAPAMLTVHIQHSD